MREHSPTTMNDFSPLYLISNRRISLKIIKELIDKRSR